MIEYIVFTTLFLYAQANEYAGQPVRHLKEYKYNLHYVNPKDYLPNGNHDFGFYASNVDSSDYFAPGYKHQGGHYVASPIQHGKAKYLKEVKEDLHYVDTAYAPKGHYEPKGYADYGYGSHLAAHGSQRALAPKEPAHTGYKANVAGYRFEEPVHTDYKTNDARYLFSGRYSPIAKDHYIGYGNKYDFRLGYRYGYGDMLQYSAPYGNHVRSGYEKLVTKHPNKYSYDHGYLPLTPVHYNHAYKY